MAKKGYNTITKVYKTAEIAVFLLQSDKGVRKNEYTQELMYEKYTKPFLKNHNIAITEQGNEIDFYFVHLEHIKSILILIKQFGIVIDNSYTIIV